MTYKTLTILVAIVLLSGCPARPVGECRVVDKHHSPMRIQYVHQRIGKVTTMNQFRHPERWDLTIEGKAEDGKTARCTIGVSKEEWDKASIGDTITR